MNRQGTDLLEKIEKMRRGLLNGNKEGDEQGEWTFTGIKGSSVIDYAICNAETWKEIRYFRIGERTESDHQPLEIELKATTEETRNKEEVKKIEIEDWSEEGIRIYKENLERRKAEKEEIQEEWEELAEEIRKAISKKKVRNKIQNIGKKPWWDKDCRNSKTRLNRSLRQMKRGNIERTAYIEEKQRHNKLCEAKKREEREREQKKIMEITNETEIWKYIKKEKGGREKTDNSIGEEQWKRYFMELLEGRDTREENKASKEQQGEVLERSTGESADGITEEEVDSAIARLKKKKAAGEDGIKNEAWLHANKETKGKLRAILQKIWQGGEIPSGWREGRIYPIHKKGSKKETGNYRGISLLDTAYKIYAIILEGRLREETNQLKILPETQAGFRKGRSCIDNIYALKTAAEKALARKKGKLYVFFADVKAAFDKVDRELLWKNMEKQSISERLIERINEIYKETTTRVISRDKVRKILDREGTKTRLPTKPITFYNIHGRCGGIFEEKTSRRSGNRQNKDIHTRICRRPSNAGGVGGGYQKNVEKPGKISRRKETHPKCG